LNGGYPSHLLTFYNWKNLLEDFKMMQNCEYCDKEFEASKSGKVGRKKKYCSERCRERHRHGIMLTHKEKHNIFVCKQCHKDFYSENVKRLCSVECENKYKSKYRKPEIRIKNEHVKTCNICNSEFTTTQSKALCCSDECRSKRRVECAKEKDYRKSYTYICSFCGIEYHPKTKNRNKYCSRECSFADLKNKSELNIARKDLVKTLNKPINDLIKTLSLIKECRVCGEKFMGKNKSSTVCSKECYLKRNNANSYKRLCKVCGKEFEKKYGMNGIRGFCSDKCKQLNEKETQKKAIKNRKHKLKKGEDGYGLYLTPLIKRDRGICQICGLLVDKKDYKITEKGYFIAGDNYPSIDHICPISKGGKHSWNNVQLAHFHCNTMKSNKLIFESANGQMSFCG